MYIYSPPQQSMSEDIWAPLLDAAPPVFYRRGQIIYLQGQPAQFLYGLHRGQVKIGMLSDQGEEKLLNIYSRGSIFGEASFFDGLPRVSTATALVDCDIVRLDRGQVDALLDRHPDLVRAMLTYLARTVRLLTGHVDTMSFLSADKRVAAYLLSCAGADGSLRRTHEEIAAAVSVSRVTVSRILSALAKQGLVETGYGVLYIRQPEALARL